MGSSTCNVWGMEHKDTSYLYSKFLGTGPATQASKVGGRDLGDTVDTKIPA